jgi:hypothetical protein
MSAVYSKALLSGSTNGKNIVVTGNGTSNAVTIHTAPAGTNTLDEVYLYAHNLGIAGFVVNIGWGGTVYPNDFTAVNLTNGQGRILIEDGRLIQNGLSVIAYTATAGTNLVVIDGFVNRITQ